MVTDVPEYQPQVSRIRRIARAVVLFAIVPYVGVTLLFVLGQRRLIYHPSRTPELTATASGFDPLHSQDVTVTSNDGVTLHGWLLEAEPGVPVNHPGAEEIASGTETPLAIYFPGNASHRAGRVNDLRDFTNLGFDVLIFDYRGYAENSGSPSEAAMAGDSRAIWRFAVDELGVDPGRILLFGESLGGAVAVRLAATLCEEGTPPAALITNATFDSVPAVAAYHYPLFPFRWLVWDRWASVDRIADISCPLLMFHGTADTIIPIANGRRLFTAARAESAGGIAKSFVEIDRAGHNNIPVSRLRDEVSRFTNRLWKAPRENSY